jgi:hypothetical protein
MKPLRAPKIDLVPPSLAEIVDKGDERTKGGGSTVPVNRCNPLELPLFHDLLLFMVICFRRNSKSNKK